MTDATQQRVLDAEIVDHAAEEFEALANDFDNHGHNSAAESARARAFQLRQVRSRMVAGFDAPATSSALQSQEFYQPLDTPKDRSRRISRRSSVVLWAWAIATPVTLLGGHKIWWPCMVVSLIACAICAMDVLDWYRSGARIGRWRLNA